SNAAIRATASNGAAAGTYQVLVDRRVSSQQMLSRGFGDRDLTGLGLTQLSVEPALGRLDRDVALSELRGGAGIARGKIVIKDSTNASATVDLSRAGSIREVVDIINANGTAAVTASVQDDHLVLKDNAGGTVTVTNGAGYTTATSLGIEGSGAGQIIGSTLSSLSDNTQLSTLNDGNGVPIKLHTSIADADLRLSVTIGGLATDVDVNVGDVYELVSGVVKKTKSGPTTVGGVLERINEALATAGATTVTASIAADGKRLSIVDSAGNPVTIAEVGTAGTGAALGLSGTNAGGSLQGKRVMAGLSTTLASTLNGGSGIAGDGALSFTARDGSTFSLTIDKDSSLAQIAGAIQSASGTIGLSPKISVGLNAQGTGLLITDNTGGAGNLTITGTSGDDTATSLGIATAGAGVASSTVKGTNLQRKYLSTATRLSTLNSGKGIGTGKFTITDATGHSSTVNIGADLKTVGDVIDQMNRSGLAVSVGLNANGDGIVVTDTSSPAGGSKIKIADSTGTVARTLNLVGEGVDAGAGNKIDGSFERVVKFEATDTLTQVVSKLNSASTGATVSIINDGSGATPFRVNVAATNSGSIGRLVIDAGSFDLGLTETQKGQDARAFFGSSDPAAGLLLTSSTNTLDGAISGVKLDLLQTTDTPVTVTVQKDTDGIETKIEGLITAFNELTSRIQTQTSYDKATDRGSILLGDGTALALRSSLFSTIQTTPKGVTPRYSRLTEIGISVGTGGQLKFDKTRFRAALVADPDAVEQMLLVRKQVDTSSVNVGTGVTANNPDSAPTFSELGILAQVEQLADRYVDSQRGILPGRGKSIDNQIASLTRQSAAIDIRLASKRAILEAQFLQMEKTIGNLQQQQGSISSIR
ncbi:MAG: flagellar filament capping protein FliD, partial [Planctomycetota bacterium]